MAEIVEEMQERLLPEYEQMLKYQICTEEQLRECIQKRHKLQARVTQNQKTMRDYLDFILFERKIHKWICEKEELLGTKLSGLKASIAKRIIRLYREGLKRFPNEERLWQNYIQFSKKSATHEVASIYEKMLTFYGDKEKVWCDAALWTYELSRDMSKVKAIFYRALLRHPQSEIINKSFFDLLLAEAANMSTEKNLDNNTKSEQDIGIEFVQVAYANSKKNVKNINYFLSLLERCEETEYCDITIPLQREIVDYLMETYAREETLWDFLAQRELRGFSTSDLRKEKYKEINNESGEETRNVETKSVWLQRTERQRIELCCKVYETAVETLQTEKMYTLYINAMLKLNQDSDTELPLKRKRLALSFKSGEETCLLSDDLLDAYIRLLTATKDGLETAKRVLEKFASSRSTIQFFELWLQVHIMDGNESGIEYVFEKAKKILGVNSIPIWRSVLNFYKFQGNIKRLDEIYREASQKSSSDFASFRAEYLVHRMETASLSETRKTYTELLQLPPPCLEMQQKMLELESKVNPKDSTRLRLYHENIVHYFGKSHLSIWLDFMKFEKEHGDPRNMSMLYNRAKAVLEPHLVDAFITEHTLFIASNKS